MRFAVAMYYNKLKKRPSVKIFFGTGTIYELWHFILWGNSQFKFCLQRLELQGALQTSCEKSFPSASMFK